MVGDDGVALSGAEALAVLERSDVLARLRGYGYQATGYSAVVPPSVGAMKAGDCYTHCTGLYIYYNNDGYGLVGYCDIRYKSRVTE